MNYLWSKWVKRVSWNTADENPSLTKKALEEYSGVIEIILSRIKTCHQDLEEKIKLINKQPNLPLGLNHRKQTLEYALIYMVDLCLDNYDKLTPFLKHSMSMESGLEYMTKYDAVKEKLKIVKLEVDRYRKGLKNDLNYVYIINFNMAILSAGEHINQVIKTQLAEHGIQTLQL
jgi:hypothetical protein